LAFHQIGERGKKARAIHEKGSDRADGKLRVRGSIDYPLAGVAVVMKRSNGRVADAGTGITAVDEALAEAVGDLAAKSAKPLTTSA
jgi:hypothetical protein